MTIQQSPRLLDVFCGAGGAARGYHDAGFEVVGVDIIPQKNYPYTFIQANVFLFQPEHPKHVIRAAGPGAIAKDGEFWTIGGHFGQKHKAQKAMGIDWMETQREIANAVPPAYTRWIAEQVMNYIGQEVTA